MNQQVQHLIVFGILLAGCGLRAQTSGGPEQADQFARLRAEIHALKAELIELKLEIERQQIAALSRETSRAEGERAILEQEQQIVEEETADLSRRLADPLTAPDHLADLRNALHSRVSAGSADLRRQLEEVRNRENALAGHLSAVRQQHAQTMRLREELAASNAR